MRIWLYIWALVIGVSIDSAAQNFIESGSALGINNTFGDIAVDGGSGGGISLYDFNMDGFSDLTLATEIGRPVLFYQNVGGNSFTQVSFNIPDISHQQQVIWVDIDNDGDLDFFIAAYGASNSLYLNDGNFNFTDISATSGIDQSADKSFGATFGDIDHDGYVDVYISNRSTHPSRLYHNNGDHTFTDITVPAGLKLNITSNFCAAFFDYDRDGDLDLYKSNDRPFNENELYRNEGNLYFTDVSAITGTDITIDAMSTCIADMNNDGRLDIYVTNSKKQPGNVLLKNNYPQPYSNLQPGSGTVMDNLWNWGGAWADYDNNGYQDLYVCSTGGGNTAQTNDLFFNNGNETFAQQNRTNMAGDADKSWSCSTGDIDNDGKMDIIVSNTANVNYKIWHNNITNTHNYVTVTLDGTTSNQDGIGSWIDVHAGTDTYTRYTHCGIGFLSQESQHNHIGISNHATIDSIVVRWSSGIIDKILSPSINQNIQITEGSNQVDFITPGGPNTFGNTVTSPTNSVARNWMELLLESIRNDYARPTVHARNLYHSSILMYDLWAAYQSTSIPFLLGRTVDGYTCDYTGIPNSSTISQDREKAISYAMYRLLRHRFQASPAAGLMIPQYIQYLTSLGYDHTETSIDYSTGDAAALGNYLAQHMIAFGLQDGSNEDIDYGNLFYTPVNDSLVMDFPGNPNLSDFNRWQPLTLDVYIDQSGNQIPINTPDFLNPEWGQVSPFALLSTDKTTFSRNGDTYDVYCDPGAPPLLDRNAGGGSTYDYQWGFALVSIWSSHLDANDNTMWDISPASIGNISSLPTTSAGYSNFYNFYNGGDNSLGYGINPVTGSPYAPQIVKRADYARVLAEFWADGPHSETPPGHWFTILNYVSDHPSFIKKYKGNGPVLNDLEWDVKSYFSLAGPLHDAAISAWGIKGWYDYIRPVSAIRGMAELGQSADPTLPSFDVGGIPLYPGYIELVYAGDPLVGANNEHLHKIKVNSWKGPDYISDPSTDEAGVDWILAENWWPYQRPSFVTPPFAGYISGHSTFSRAAAEVMTALTGDPFFPDGLGQFSAAKNEFLVFEEGPSDDITLQWATYRDASDQCSLSRIWGGIHPPADDIPGRIIGKKIGIQGFNLAEYFITGLYCQNGTIVENSNPIPKRYYHGHEILSSGTVGSPSVTFEASNHILLENGFEISTQMAQFLATIAGCP